jgi:ABC-type ATPase with predicted acetyltransferase domain
MREQGLDSLPNENEHSLMWFCNRDHYTRAVISDLRKTLNKGRKYKRYVGGGDSCEWFLTEDEWKEIISLRRHMDSNPKHRKGKWECPNCGRLGIHKTDIICPKCNVTFDWIRATEILPKRQWRPEHKNETKLIEGIYV